MSKLKYDIFISHSSKDRNRVEALKEKLEAAGIKVWTDHKIRPGQSLPEEINKAIEASRYVLVLVSKNSLNSEWANFETGVALRKAKESHEIKILPAIDPDIDRSRLPYGLRSFQAIDPQDTEKIISQVKANISG